MCAGYPSGPSWLQPGRPTRTADASWLPRTNRVCGRISVSGPAGETKLYSFASSNFVNHSLHICRLSQLVYIIYKTFVQHSYNLNKSCPKPPNWSWTVNCHYIAELIHTFGIKGDRFSWLKQLDFSPSASFSNSTKTPESTWLVTTCSQSCPLPVTNILLCF